MRYLVWVIGSLQSLDWNKCTGMVDWNKWTGMVDWNSGTMN